MERKINLIEQDNLEVVKVDYSTAWKNYKEENKGRPKSSKINTEVEFKRIIKECLKQIAYYWSNSTGGIYIKGLGYFSFFRPLKKFTTMSDPRFLNTVFRTHGYYYLSTHITNLKSTDSFGGFKIKRTYESVKKQAHANIVKGRRYTFNNKIIQEYIKKRTFI